MMQRPGSVRRNGAQQAPPAEAARRRRGRGAARIRHQRSAQAPPSLLLFLEDSRRRAALPLSSLLLLCDRDPRLARARPAAPPEPPQQSQSNERECNEGHGPRRGNYQHRQVRVASYGNARGKRRNSQRESAQLGLLSPAVLQHNTGRLQRCAPAASAMPTRPVVAAQPARQVESTAASTEGRVAESGAIQSLLF